MTTLPKIISLNQARLEAIAGPKPIVAPATADSDFDETLPDDDAPATLQPKVAPAWPKPRPIARPAAPGLDFDAVFPPRLQTFRRYCEGLAEALQVPRDAVPPLALAIASGCIARAVETRAGPDWLETAPLWFAVLMESAERKSAIVAALSRPVFDWQADEAEALRRPLASHAENRRCLEAELATARGRYAKTRPGTLERTEAQTAVREIAESLADLPALAAPAILTADVTPESLRDLLASNGEKALWISAEADAASLTGKRYAKSGEANLNLFLAAKSGEACPGQRIGRDISLRRPALAAALCVQPCALDEVLADPYARGRGFVPRFNIITPPSRLGSRLLHPAPLDATLAAWWGATLRALLALPWPGRVVSAGGELKRHDAPPRELRLAREAVTILDAFRAPIESRIGPNGDLYAVQAYASKLPGELVRIAAVLELLADPAAVIIAPETMRAAVAWGAFLLDHHRHALGEATTAQATKDARRLLDLLRRHRTERISQRDAGQLADLDRDATQAALAILDDEGWTRELPPPVRTAEEIARGGRPPSPLREVNPELFAE